MEDSSNIFVISVEDLGNPVDDLGQINSIGALPSSPFEVISSPGGLENDQQCSPRCTESDSVTVETPINGAGRDGLLSPVLRIQQHEKSNLCDRNPGKSQLILQQFFDISCCLCCTSPVAGSDDRKYLRSLQQICCGTLVSLSCFDSIVSMNLVYMKEGTKDFHRYTELGFHVINILCKLYHIKVLATVKRQLDTVNRLLIRFDDSFCKLVPLIRQRQMELPGYIFLVLLIGVLPMVASVLWGVFGYWTYKDWSWTTALYFGALDVGRTFVVWEQGKMEAGNNRTEELLFAYTPDSVWIALGSLRLSGKVAAYMERFALCNLMLALGVSLFKHTKPMIRVFKLLGNQLANGVANSQTQLDQTQFEEAWKYYFRLRQASGEINRAFGGVIKCAHVSNIFSLLVILLITVFSQQTVLTTLLYLYEMILLLAFYIFATNVNQVNGFARKWIKDNTIPSSPIEVNTRTLNVLLDDIKQTPIGLGSGNFHVDGGFIPRVLGLLASLLAFMVEAETDAIGPA